MKDDREALRLALSTPKPELANEILALRAENERLREEARRARNVGLEEAAREADNHLPKDHWEARDSTFEYNQACRDIAAAIRALKEPTE